MLPFEDILAHAQGLEDYLTGINLDDLKAKGKALDPAGPLTQICPIYLKFRGLLAALAVLPFVGKYVAGFIAIMDAICPPAK